MKNILSENMQRFGTKNLTEAAKKKLIVKSIMETIDQHGLHKQIKSALNEQFNADNVANIWIQALKGVGTDEAKAWTAISSINSTQDFDAFDQAVKAKTGDDVKTWFLGDFSIMTDEYEKLARHIDKVTNGERRIRDEYTTFNALKSDAAKGIGMKSGVANFDRGD